MLSAGAFGPALETGQGNQYSPHTSIMQLFQPMKPGSKWRHENSEKTEDL